MKTSMAVLSGLELTDSARSRIALVDPELEVYSVPYLETMALRNARSRGAITPEMVETAPHLDADSWSILERSTVVVGVDLPFGLLERTPSLRWVQGVGAGFDHLPVGELAQRGIILTNGSGVAAPPIAEFVMGRLLQVWKEFRALDQLQSEHRWVPHFGASLAGKTLGIVGLGAIGRATARRARAFDMLIVANRRSAVAGETDSDVDRLYPASEIDDMLPECDAVVVAAPASKDTNGLFGRDRLAKMKRGAVLCNVARGALVDEEALADALHSGYLSAAILDVTADEPTPADSPLWTAPNCYLSSHCAIAAGFMPRALLELVLENLQRTRDGRPLKNTVLGSG